MAPHCVLEKRSHPLTWHIVLPLSVSPPPSTATKIGAFFPPWPWTRCSLFLELPFLLDLTFKFSRIVFKYCLVPDNFSFPKMIIILLSVPPLCNLVNLFKVLFACLCCYVVTLTNRNLVFTNGCHQSLCATGPQVLTKHHCEVTSQDFHEINTYE